ncbi:MAG: class I SAM-dependent methyltransferase [Candidatus Eisenbacteria bacterium]
MSRKTMCLSDQIYEYMLSVSLREPELLRRLREETACYEDAEMQISPEQGQFMAFLVKLIGACKVLELGVFTGYSSLWVGLALPENGRMVACDVSEEWTAVARRYWEEAGIAHKIDLRLGAAQETLKDLIASGHGGSFDFAFIDADKVSLDDYFEGCLELVRTGGLIAIDNVLMRGRAADTVVQEEKVRVVRALNRKLHGDARVDVSLVPISDGLTLIHKRH